MRFFITSASNMPLGAGYVEVEADDRDHARHLAFKYMPDGRWSFDYKALDDIHPLDRKLKGRISEKDGFTPPPLFENCFEIPTDLCYIGLRHAVESYEAKTKKVADTIYYSTEDIEYIPQIKKHTDSVGQKFNWVLVPEYQGGAWSVGIAGDFGCGSEGA